MDVEIIFEVTGDPVDGGFVASALGHGITRVSGDQLKKAISTGASVCASFLHS
jgi:hypothetical protein